MLAALLFLVVLACAAWAVRSNRAPDPARVPRMLLALGGTFLLSYVLRELARLPLGPAAASALTLVRAATGLALWAEVGWLSTYGPRTRAKWLRIIFAGLAVFLALVHAPWEALAAFAILATQSFGWRKALSTRQLFGAALAAMALFALRMLHVVPQDHGAEAHGALLTAHHLEQWAGVVTLFYLASGVFKALAAFVRDPSLGIRTVRRRLALSHLLVVLVPLVITVGLWVLTTWLGAGSDHALVAKRAVAAEADGLRRSLVQALRAPGEPAAALRAAAAARQGEWPHVHVWRISGDAVQRVAGDSLALEGALPAWTAGLGRLPASGVVEIGRTRWLGAAARDTARGEAAVALVPITEALAGAPSRLAGAHIWMAEQSLVGKPDSSEADAGADADSAAIRRARAIARRMGIPDSSLNLSTGPSRGAPKVVFSSGSDTLVGASEDMPADSVNGSGRATAEGVVYDGARWSKDDFPLAVRLTFRETVIGLFQNARENPYNFIPIGILVGLILLLLPVVLFNLTLVRQLGRSFVLPVAALREGTRALGASRLDYRIPVGGEDELWDAASAFNHMAEGLEKAREVEKERDRLENELDLARRIQQRLLPAGPPQVAGLEIAGHSEPAREVGGDYYDHIPLGDDRVLLVIADVSGKGVPAALLMSAFRASLMSQDSAHCEPSDVAMRLNAFLHRSVDPGKFVTAFVGFLDGRTGRFVYANAGHNPPALLRKDGTVEWLTTGGLILGILPDSRFESGEAQLEPGDLLALYTDGVTEGADATAEQFGEDRLVEALRRRVQRSCAEIAEGIVREVRAFEGEQGPADDITMLLARRRKS